FLAPGIVALAVMSTAMVGLGIATGFERQYGVLKRLGVTPLGRPALLAAKTLSIAAVEMVQVAVLALVALALGWHAHGSIVVGAGRAGGRRAHLPLGIEAHTPFFRVEGAPGVPFDAKERSGSGAHEVLELDHHRQYEADVGARERVIAHGPLGRAGVGVDYLH